MPKNKKKTPDMKLKIAFPPDPPLHGYIQSISFLDRHGLLQRGEYERALRSAGFVVFEESDERWLEVADTPSGVFSNGLQGEAVELLEAMASEGFSGFAFDQSSGVALIIGGGRVSAGPLAA